MAKRGRQIGEGVYGAGLRAGEMIGAVDPSTVQSYEQRVQDERSVMSPNYRSFTPSGGAEITGSTLVDILGGGAVGKAFQAGRNAPKIGGTLEGVGNAMLPVTIPQAAAGGAIYSLTTPSESGSEMVRKGVEGVALGGGSQFALRQAGLAPKLPPNLTPQQQEVARRAIAEGFQLDPSQITGYGNAVREGVKSRFPMAREAFTRLEDGNQATTNTIAKQFIGLPANAPLTNDTMRDAFNNALKNYKSLENVPSVMGDARFKIAVDSAIRQMRAVPRTQLNSFDRRALRVLEEYQDFASKPISGYEAFQRSQKIGENLFEAQKASSPQAVEAFKALRNAFEDSIERYLSAPANQMRTGGTQVLDQFKQGRELLSNFFLVDSAFNRKTGNVSAPKLSFEMSKNPNYGTTNRPIETAAMVSGAFPNVFPTSGTSERMAFSNPLSMLLQSPVAIPAYAATSAPVRNILAQKYLGAPPEGLIGNLYGAIANVGGRIPAPVRNTTGRTAQSIMFQRNAQDNQPVYGLLGN